MSMLASAKGRCKASAQTERLSDSQLANASSGAASRPMVVSSMPRSCATARARLGISPSPVPTSRSVALDGKLWSAARISLSADLSPPNSELARFTSASDRVTIAGSTSGESSISTPRRRGGVSRSRTSVLQLSVPAAIVEERSSDFGAGGFHFTEDDRVIPAVICGEAIAFQHCQHIVENRVAPRRARDAHTLEPVDVHDRKPACELLLFRRQNVHDKTFRRRQRLVSRRQLLDGDENEWRVEANGAERADRHSVVGSVASLCRNHRHSRWKPAENGAKLVLTNAQVLNAGEMKRLKRKRGLRTTFGGTKSPATPTSKSARSFRRERTFAALLRKYGWAMDIPTMRSSFHFPPNSC